MHASTQLQQLIAFFLPQYHPIPENDRWWGRGFTEWRNVASGRPLFHGHYQPHLPADLGYYDLRIPEVREEQANLARQYGISAFCYYHYWFGGRRLLERPVEDLLRTGRPDFPFCLCWANENWTRSWDGGNREVLMAQAYSPKDDDDHIHSLLPAFRDPRYLRHQELPIFLVYSASNLPNPLETTRRWRAVARDNGLHGLYLLRVESVHESRTDPRELGFDAAVEFQPEWRSLHEPRWHHYRRRLLQKLRIKPPRLWYHRVREYSAIVDSAIAKPLPSYPFHRCVAPSWDNSARRSKGALILKNCNPGEYARWLSHALRQRTSNLVFINAWNEWAEGCHLEPCLRYERAYLEATLRAKESFFSDC